MSIKILLTGATGYIGGDLLIDLLKRSEFEITVFIRGSQRSSAFQELGAKVIVGDQNDQNLVAKIASEFDVVIHTSDSLEIGVSKLLLAGLEQGKKNHQRKGILIQTSGSGVVLESTLGEYATDKVWSDLDVAAFYQLPKDAAHRELDIFITEYPQDKVTTAIISPSNVYGVGRGPFNRLSMINITFERVAIKYKALYGFGKGANIWSTHHVRDLSTAYIKLLDGLLNGTAGHGTEGYYFVENGEIPIGKVVERIGHELKKKGILQDTTVIDMPDQVLQLFRIVLGGNSRVKADHLRQLGWKPEYGDPLETVADEIDLLLTA
ncbi:hypothetical protein BGW37DRAFT_418536 [Umbelopsis sp. PMI_123]|nr:hypothetical protein BGW37DRAFT_418536 [Umbelopsis sp. PMI_123]